MARFSPEQLRDKALHALEEAFEQCGSGPVDRTRALRFAITYLANRAKERDCFDIFWQAVTGSRDQDVNPMMADGLRKARATEALLTIYAEHGLQRGS